MYAPINSTKSGIEKPRTRIAFSFQLLQFIHRAGDDAENARPQERENGDKSQEGKPASCAHIVGIGAFQPLA